jgi:hypothetical protein
MDKQLIGNRIFNLKDQEAFSKCSGDLNPIHIDPIYSRRAISGQCIVHGMNGLMWAIDSIINYGERNIIGINFKFIKSIYLNEEVLCYWDKLNKKILLESARGFLFTEVQIINGILDYIEPSLIDIQPPLTLPFDRNLSDLMNLEPQKFSYRGDMALLASQFPGLVRFFGLNTCCEIVVLSEIVGMQTPGLNSLFIGGQIFFNKAEGMPHFQIKNVDNRINLVKIDVIGCSIKANLKAILLPALMPSLQIGEIVKHVSKDEFKNINALIIGGSRGLGAGVAKILAAGGGSSIITYSVGAHDANKIVDDIEKFGMSCRSMQLKIPSDTESLGLVSGINQVYYFPTPKIFGKRTNLFIEELYIKFQEIYVDGFLQIVLNFHEKKESPVFFYPSTDAINHPLPELAEYIKAKIGGEELCRKLNRSGRCKIVIERLFRTDTDQTANLGNVTAMSLLECLLPIIRKMQKI